MANIGSFKKSGQEFQGEIVTLSLQKKGVRIVPETDRTNDNSPSHRVYVGRAERLSLGQAGRSELQRSDLRQPLRRRRRRDLHPDLVAVAQERRLSHASVPTPRSPERGVSQSQCPTMAAPDSGLRSPRCAPSRLHIFADPHRPKRRLQPFRFGAFVRSPRASSSGCTRSMWLMPRAAARWKRVTTVGLRRPRSRSLTYCCVKPETSAKCSWVKPFSLRNFPKFRPTSLRISMRASCVFTYYEVYPL